MQSKYALKRINYDSFPQKNPILASKYTPKRINRNMFSKNYL